MLSTYSFIMTVGLHFQRGDLGGGESARPPVVAGAHKSHPGLPETKGRVCVSIVSIVYGCDGGANQEWATGSGGSCVIEDHRSASCVRVAELPLNLFMNLASFCQNASLLLIVSLRFCATYSLLLSRMRELQICDGRVPAVHSGP